ncbi:MAG: hypothetical protein ABJG78_15485 [Cyclobacteriaceae bacterium]
MKRFMMITALCCIGLAMHGQGKRGGQQKPSIEERTERAKKELSLSNEQADQWIAIHKKYEKDLQTARESREQGKKVFDKLDAELRAILDDDQKSRFTEMQKKRPRGRKPGG